MNFFLKEEKDINRVLNRFENFHAGVVKTLTLKSHDYFSGATTLACIGIMDIDITFAHNRYTKGLPYNQKIFASFKEVQEIKIGVPHIKPGDWSIEEVKINKRVTDFFVKIVFSIYSKNRKWENLEGVAFSFKSAIFSEKYSVGVKKLTPKSTVKKKRNKKEPN